MSEHPASSNNLALPVHAGSTTGIPKGATLTHHNILANIAQPIAWVPALHEDAEVFYCALPLSRAFGFTIGFFAGFRLGTSVTLLPKFDTTMIFANQKRLPCTFLLNVPPTYERLLKAVETMDVDLSSMTFSLSEAMPLSGELAKRWEEAAGGLMAEGYDITEASPIILGSPLSDSRRPDALGIPFSSTQTRTVDPEDPGAGIPEGGISELTMRGPQVFSSYWERPEETVEALWNGWLRTDDLVRVQDGLIHMADRHKEMINTPGFNVYPGQTEDTIRDMPGVRDIAVTDLSTGGVGENVVAVIVLEAGASIALTDVCQWAKKSIAHYALPRQIVVMTELSRSQLGRIMYKEVRGQTLNIADSVFTTAGQTRNVADQMRSAVDQVRGTADPATASAVAKLRSLKNRE